MNYIKKFEEQERLIYLRKEKAPKKGKKSSKKLIYEDSIIYIIIQNDGMKYYYLVDGACHFNGEIIDLYAKNNYEIVLPYRLQLKSEIYLKYISTECKPIKLESSDEYYKYTNKNGILTVYYNAKPSAYITVPIIYKYKILYS